jgi:hypothetical protein
MSPGTNFEVNSQQPVAMEMVNSLLTLLSKAVNIIPSLYIIALVMLALLWK